MAQISHAVEQWPLKQPFVTSRGAVSHFEAFVLEIRSGDHLGRAEAQGVPYRGEDGARMAAEIEAVRPALEAGVDRAALPDVLGPGGARNAVDCALWDLEAKAAGRSVWSGLGLAPAPVATVATVSVGAPAAMARQAALYADHPVLKVKLDADRPIEKTEAVRAAAPAARLVVDANEAWTLAQLAEVAPALHRLGVEMIEQPLPRGEDGDLAGYRAPMLLGADESCNVAADIPALVGRYDLVNIKLDKCGGLTEALRMLDTAAAAGLAAMVGSMGGTSLAMAPAFVIAQRCLYVDIDGPILLARDRPGGMAYRTGVVSPPDSSFWG